MSDRYSKLFALSENLYSVGAPVVIAAGALQKDNQTGKIFAQLKIRNIQDKTIKAATVKITPFDTAGKPLGGTIDYQYLDLSAGRDTDFGQKTPVMLKEAATRSFAVSVSEVIFSDNSIWTASNEVWEPLSASITPEKAFADGELAKQYRAKYGADCKCIFKKEKDLWRCACGEVNHDSEKNCHKCQREAAALAALNVEELKADRDRRLAAEQKKAAEEEAAAAEQAKKTKKIAMIAAPIVVVAIVAAVLISNLVKAQQEEAARLDAYNAAVALAEAGQFDEAIAAFVGLGDYKDSADKIPATRYTQAMSLFEAGEYDKAISMFTGLGDYKDSAAKIDEIQAEIDAMILAENEAAYEQAMEYLNEGRKLRDAYELFSELGDFKDSAEKAEDTYVQSMINTFDGVVGNTAFSYFTENRTTFTLLDEDEINAVIPGNWLICSRSGRGFSSITLTGDGFGDYTYVADSVYHYHWLAEGNTFFYDSYTKNTYAPFDTSDSYNYLELRKVKDGFYIAYRTSGNTSGEPRYLFVRTGTEWADRLIAVSEGNANGTYQVK